VAKKASLSLVLLLIASGVCFGAEPLKPNFPWDCPNPKGNIANDVIFYGFIGDISGAAFIMGSTAGFLVGDGSLGFIFLEVGGLGCATGAFLMDMGVEQRHAALMKLKYKIKADTRDTSRMLALGSSVLGFGGVILKEANGIVFKDATIGIVAVVAYSVGAILEVVNVLGPRLEWIRDINFAVSGLREKKLSLEDDFTVAPQFLVSIDPRTEGIKSSIGISARINL
jgi:hypothetical protein